jgi:hypothetical protein
MLQIIWTLLNLFYLYGYLYLTVILNMFYSDTHTMKEKWFHDYITKVNNSSKNINLYEKISITGDTLIENKKNLLLLNHNSILDNMVLAKIFAGINSIGWNKLRTISRISSRNIQNKALKIQGNLLISKDFQQDISACKEKIEEWKNSQEDLQIILCPEGTIYQKNTFFSDSEKKVLNNSLNKENTQWQQVLFPKTGIFNFLIDNMKEEIKNIYDISCVYLLDGKRIHGEKNIIGNIHNKNFKVMVKMKHYSMSDLKLN